MFIFVTILLFINSIPLLSLFIIIIIIFIIIIIITFILAPKVKRYHSIEGRSPQRSTQQVRPVKPPLDVIRASLSPPPPPPHSSPSHPPPSHLSPLVPSLSQEYEIIEKPEEPITISRKKSTSDFPLIKFAKMLFLGKRGSKAGTPEKIATPVGLTPEHKRGGRERGKERKSKSPGRGKKRKSQSIEADPPRDKQGDSTVNNTSTSSPSHSGKAKDSPGHKKKTSTGSSTSNKAKTSSNTSSTSGVRAATNTSTTSAVQNLTRLYEGHSVDPLASAPRSSSPAGNMSSRTKPVASGTVASVIKKLEERGGESVDYELEGINVEGETNREEGDGERRVATDSIPIEDALVYDVVESGDDAVNESLLESVSIVLDQEEKEEEEEEEEVMVPKGRSYTLSESTQFNYLRHEKVNTNSTFSNYCNW